MASRTEALCNALQAAPSSVGTIAKVLSNIVGQPAESKYRKLRLANKRIQEAVVDVDGGVELLQVAQSAEQVTWMHAALVASTLSSCTLMTWKLHASTCISLVCEHSTSIQACCYPPC